MRPTRDEWAIELALTTARRSTCLRRQVGCVLLSARGHVLSTGYNGVAAGQPHCNMHDPYEPTGFPHACEGARAVSGTSLDLCEAIHAEQNALLQCHDVYKICTCYTTTSPCMTCIKLLLNTSCEEIVFIDDYPQPKAKALWLASGRKWTKTPTIHSHTSAISRALQDWNMPGHHDLSTVLFDLTAVVRTMSSLTEKCRASVNDALLELSDNVDQDLVNRLDEVERDKRRS